MSMALLDYNRNFDFPFVTFSLSLTGFHPTFLDTLQLAANQFVLSV